MQSRRLRLWALDVQKPDGGVLCGRTGLTLRHPGRQRADHSDQRGFRSASSEFSRRRKKSIDHHFVTPSLLHPLDCIMSCATSVSDHSTQPVDGVVRWVWVHAVSYMGVCAVRDCASCHAGVGVGGRDVNVFMKVNVLRRDTPWRREAKHPSNWGTRG